MPYGSRKSGALKAGTQMTTYLALLRKDDDSEYGVDFPDFPGCITAGQTLGEARRMAAEALGAHINAMVEDGEAIPTPSDLDAIMNGADTEDALPFLVSAPCVPTGPRQVLVTLSEDLLAAIDKVTDDRSAFLIRAAHKELMS